MEGEIRLFTLRQMPGRSKRFNGMYLGKGEHLSDMAKLFRMESQWGPGPFVVQVVRTSGGLREPISVEVSVHSTIEDALGFMERKGCLHWAALCALSKAVDAAGLMPVDRLDQG